VADRKLEAECLLVAVGRRPHTQGLALDKAGLEVTASGHVEVDAGMQTRAGGIFAVGDVTAGSTQLAHAATAQGVLAAEIACGRRMRGGAMLVPSCIFTDPEIGCVGLTEQKAAAEQREIVTGKFSFMALGKAMASGETTGFVKWVADAKTGQLLGAQAVGAHATELIAEATLAVRGEWTLEEVGGTVHCHPTLSEAWMEAAHAAHGESVHVMPRRKRL